MGYYGTGPQNYDEYMAFQNRGKPQAASSTATLGKPNANTVEGLKQFIEEQLGTYGGRARAGEAEEEKRGKGMEDYLRQAEAEAHKPTLSEEDINRQMSFSSDSASGNFQNDMAGLREYMGESGVTGGGLPAGIAAGAEIERLGQLTRARGDLMAYKATTDALDRQKAWDRATTVAGAIDRPISMLGIDYENQALQTRLAEFGIQSNADSTKYAAKKSSDATKKAGTMGLLSSLIPS